MKILAVETSCDDTCVSVIEIRGKKMPRFKVLSNVVSSQIEIHKKWGGVYPTLAKREHQRNLAPVLKQSLLKARLLKSKIKNQTGRFAPCNSFGIKQKSKISRFYRGFSVKSEQIKTQKLKEILKREEILYKQLKEFLEKYQKPDIDLIAVTNGPGLEPCLWTGVNFAKALSFFWELPLIPVNHIEAHIFANWLKPISESQISNLKSQIFPAVCLVVSGGHTQLILMECIGKYKILGETRDDAAGECFDKAAKILGLEYPGGPAIANQAKKYRGRTPAFLPRPMIFQKNYDFSFSGLKTAVLYNFKKQNLKTRASKEYIVKMATETQQAIIDVLIAKTIKAAKDYRAKTIILGGGVSANDELRKQFNYKLLTINYKINFLVPPKNLCTDNAAMIAITAYFHKNQAKINWSRWRSHRGSSMPTKSSILDKVGIKSGQKIKAEANLRIS